MKANEAESYPIQFKDKIDESLWKEHHILGGCCSSIESMKYTVAREVAEKLTDAFIEKAAEWLSEIENGTTNTDIDKFVEEFKKAMKL